MEPLYQPRQGIARYLCGTQPITSLAMVECGLDTFSQTSMAALRAKSLALTTLFIDLVRQSCSAHPLTLITPLGTIALGVMFTGDQFDTQMVIGTAIALLGVLIVAVRRTNAPTSLAQEHS